MAMVIVAGLLDTLALIVVISFALYMLCSTIKTHHSIREREKRRHEDVRQ